MKEDATEEVWVYGGVRISHDEAKYGVWFPVVGDIADLSTPLSFTKDWRGYYVGMEYRVNFDGNTRYGKPVFHQQHGDVEARAQLLAQDAAASTKVRRLALEKRKATELDDAIEPLRKLTKALPASQRTEFLAYVLRRLL